MIQSPHHIFIMLDEAELALNKFEMYSGRGIISFDVNHECYMFIKDMTSLSCKINPIKDEFLKLTFDWGQLECNIYCYE